MYYIYRHILPDGLSYIGKTKNIEKRYQNGKGYKKCPKFYKAIVKYGWDNIKHEILYTIDDECKARGLEKDMIEKYDSIENGYNSVNKRWKYVSKRTKPLQKFNQYDLNGNFIKRYESANELWKNGFNPDAIRGCCRGRTKTSQGYIWKFDKETSTHEKKGRITNAECGNLYNR